MTKTGTTKEKLLQVAFDLIWDSSYGCVSVGDICERAGVNKGSFYHFFASKADLAVAAYQEKWNQARPVYDRIFSPQVPPMQRLHDWCEFVCVCQQEKAEKYGRVCGCPYASIGAEIATREEAIRAESQRLSQCGVRYVESAIADAIREGAVTVTDASLAAQRVNSVVIGMLVQAKVQNSLEGLRDLEPAVMSLLGAKLVAV